MKNKIILLTSSLMLIVPQSVSAQRTEILECKNSKAVVGFVNGILNDKTMSRASANQLRESYISRYGESEDVEFELYWNYGQSVKVSRVDAFQTILNKALQEDAIASLIPRFGLPKFISEALFGIYDNLLSLP